MPKKLDVAGMRFGRLIAVKECGKTNSNHTLWECICDCGNKAVAEIAHLMDGRRVSCGCARKAGMQIHPKKGRHGHCSGNGKTKEYRIWSGMVTRCSNLKSQNWHRYGGRGIKVCERWELFDNFITDMGLCPNGCSLDRIDNDGNYEPSNCRWATDIEQHRNRSDNVFWEYDGITLTISGWAEKLDINRHTLADRVRKSGWSIEKTLFTPIQTPSDRAYVLNKKRWGFERKIYALSPPIPDTANCVTDGRIQFLGDCTHALASQTVDLPSWPLEDE